MSEVAAARAAEASLQTILKAVVVGARSQDSASRPGGDDVAQAFAQAGALEPPYDPEALCLLMEHSNSLRQNVDAYATNIDGFGHRFEPAIDFEAEDADQQVADAVYLERAAAHERGELGGGALQPTAEEAAARRHELQQLARLERAQLEAFFDFCCFDHLFADLRRRTRQDLEVTGNAYWEVLRDGRGRIVRLVYVPAYTVRLLPLAREAVEVQDRIRVSRVTFESTSARRRMRRYVQLQGGERVYFKAFRDPRVVSQRTGQVFDSIEALLEADENDGPATEMVHFAIHSPRSPYGIPRWIGTLLSVLGSRQMEEVNYLYFENKSVPPLALLVSGGRLAEASVPRIERFIEENLKGKNNFHKVLILEAESGDGAGDGTNAKIELRPLTDAQQQDALFQVYDERNMDKVGSAFRLPKLLRGESKDFNRATAESALRFAEDQVFQPERDEFDFMMNRRVLADMGIRFWRFRSQTPVARDPERMTQMVEKLVRVGVLTPEEGRILAGDIFNREFQRLGDDWTKRPITLTLAGVLKPWQTYSDFFLSPIGGRLAFLYWRENFAQRQHHPESPRRPRRGSPEHATPASALPGRDPVPAYQGEQGPGRYPRGAGTARSGWPADEPARAAKPTPPAPRRTSTWMNEPQRSWQKPEAWWQPARLALSRRCGVLRRARRSCPGDWGRD